MQVAGCGMLSLPLLASQTQEAVIGLRLWFHEPPHLPLVAAQGGWGPAKGPEVGREMRAGPQGDYRLA